jgi:hypothetical protein
MDKNRIFRGFEDLEALNSIVTNLPLENLSEAIKKSEPLLCAVRKKNPNGKKRAINMMIDLSSLIHYSTFTLLGLEFLSAHRVKCTKENEKAQETIESAFEHVKVICNELGFEPSELIYSIFQSSLTTMAINEIDDMAEFIGNEKMSGGEFLDKILSEINDEYNEMTEKVSKDLLDLDELMNDPVKAIEEGRKSGKIKSVDFIDKSGDTTENISDTLNKIEEMIKGHNGCGLSLKTKDIIKGYNKGIIAGEKIAPLMTDSDNDKVRNFFKSAEKANKSVVVTPLTSTVKDISRSLCDYTITNDFEMMFPSEKDKSSIEKCKCRMVMKQFIMDSFLYHENILTPQATLANMFSGVEPEPVNSITLTRIPSYEITLNKYLESIKNRSDNNTIIENLELKRTLNKFKSGVATAIKKVEIYAEGKKEPIMSQVAYIMYTYSQNRKGKEMNAK